MHSTGQVVLDASCSAHVPTRRGSRWLSHLLFIDNSVLHRCRAFALLKVFEQRCYGIRKQAFTETKATARLPYLALRPKSTPWFLKQDILIHFYRALGRTPTVFALDNSSSGYDQSNASEISN
jgi:hypothetical protein